MALLLPLTSRIVVPDIAVHLLAQIHQIRSKFLTAKGSLTPEP